VSSHLTAPNQKELDAAWAFLNTERVRFLIRAGGSWALVFGPTNGIASPVTVTVKGINGEIISQNVTDYESW
jgi:hypothetical protein